MPFELVEEPVSSPEAFSREGDAATLSAAAVLLVLGFHLRGDEQALTARASEVFGTGEPALIALPPEDVGPLRVPPLAATGERIDPSEAQAWWTDSRPPSRYPPAISLDVIQRVALQFDEDPTHLHAAELFEACLRHPEEVARVAAASSYLDLTTDPRHALDVLRQALRSEDSLTREVAAMSLAHFVPEDPLLARRVDTGQSPEGGDPSRTCILIHGTRILRESTWWKPGADFHQYLKDEVRSDVYSAADRFSWDGGYSDAARANGAIDLLGWVRDHDLNGLDVFGHSHGGNLAMLATRGGLEIGNLVLLSCPVHIPKYLPQFSRVKKIVSIGVRMDIMVLADRGGQRFNLPDIKEHRLPLWFNHSATHDPDVWRKYDVPQWL